MGFYRVHSEPVRRHYFATPCSCAILFQLFVSVCIIVGPWILAYYTEGMWMFERCYRQQADIRYKHQAYFVARNDADFSTMVWSTSNNFNKMMQKRLRVPTLRSYEADENNDGKKEYLDVELELPLADTESVSSIQVLLLFDYQLTDMVDVHMESAAFFEFTGAGSGSELSVDGPLVFKQLDPLAWNGERYQYNQPVVNSSSYAPADYDFATILQNYENRNETTVYEPRYTVWKADRGQSQPFTLKMRVRYRPQRICYRPGFLYELKNGWIQYLAMLVPVYMFASYVQWFVFNNRVVHSVVKLDPFPDTKRQ